MRSKRARRNDPDTSHEAGNLLSKEMLRKQYRLIEATMQNYGPGTMHDISANCVLDTEQIHRRLPEMEDMGVVYRNGNTAVGPSRRRCKIWYLVEDGNRPAPQLPRQMEMI